MFFTELVDIPDIPGKIVFRKKYKSVYVHYEVGREYKKDKQYTIPKRVIIGKKKEGEENKMYPNENYSKYFSFTPLHVVHSQTQFEENPNGVSEMCKTMEDMRNESIRIGEIKILAELVKDNILSVEDAARRANMTVDAFVVAMSSVTPSPME